jgi:hypothetical protein
LAFGALVEILALAVGTALRVVIESTIGETSRLGLRALVSPSTRIGVILPLGTATNLSVRPLFEVGAVGHLPLLGLTVIARLIGSGADLRARTAEVAVGGRTLNLARCRALDLRSVSSNLTRC